MIRDEQIRILKGLINHLDSKTNVDAGGIMKAPADTYTSQERFDREWDSFFLNHPQIIGRFRVLKTDILKIDVDNLSIDNYKTFQSHLKDIIVSYNAFVNIMNLEVTKDKNEKFIID